MAVGRALRFFQCHPFPSFAGQVSGKTAGLWMIRNVFSLFDILHLVGGFKYFLFSPIVGNDSHFDQYFSQGMKPPTISQPPFKNAQFDERIFQLGWFNHQL